MRDLYDSLKLGLSSTINYSETFFTFAEQTELDYEGRSESSSHF